MDKSKIGSALQLTVAGSDTSAVPPESLEKATEGKPAVSYHIDHCQISGSASTTPASYAADVVVPDNFRGDRSRWASILRGLTAANHLDAQASDRRREALARAFGLWRDRPDLPQDGADYQRELRSEWR